MKESIEKVMKKYFEYFSKYPDLVQELRTIKSLAELQQKMTPFMNINEVSKDLILDENLLLEPFIIFLSIFESAENKIIEIEKAKEYTYPTFLFYTEKVLEHARHLDKVMLKRNYLKYILKEYRNHLPLRNTIYKEELTRALISIPDLPEKLFKASAHIFIHHRNKLQHIFFPENFRTFEESIKDELFYYLSYEEEPEHPEPILTIDKENFKLSDLIKRLSDSLTVEIKDPKKFVNIVYSFFNLLPPDSLAKEMKSESKLKGTTKSDENSSGDEFLTIAQLEKILKIKRTTLYQWRKSGKLPYIRSGSRVLFQKSAIDEYIKENSIQLQ